MAAITDEMEASFFRACKKNQVAEVVRMLDEAPDLIKHLKQENNAVAYVCLQANTHGANFPSCAGTQDCLEMVRVLLDRGCDPNFRGNDGVMTALHYAANANDALSQVAIVRLLVQRGADPSAAIDWDPSLTPLKQVPPPPAAVVEILRNAPAIHRAWEEEAAAAAAAAAVAEAIPPIRALYPDMEPPAIFMKAIRYAREEDVRMVLQHYRDEVINQAVGNLAPIEHAATLISMAAPVTPGLSEEKVRQRQYWRDPACGMAMMELLLREGEDPNRRGCDTAISAIQMAATCNDQDLVVLLLAYGADPNLRDLDGYSAKSVAEHTNNAGMLEILNAAATIREHFLATGRHEWPIVPDDEPEPEIAPLERQETDYQPQMVPGPRLEQRIQRIKTRCLEQSKEHGRPNKQKEVYESGVACHVPQPPNIDPDGDSDGEPSPAKVQYVKDRENFIAATIKQLRGTDPTDWKHKTLQIKFHAQQGLDWGGLTKAFVKFMSDCLFDEDLPNTLFQALTTEDDSDELMGVPKVASLWKMKTDAQLAAIPNWQERMQWVGRFLGYCLWTGEAVNMPLLPSVYSYLLDKELNWRDMMLDKPKVYTSYMQMLAMAPDEVEFLCFTMSVDDGTGGLGAFELVEGGQDIDVTGENVHEFARRAAMAHMLDLHREGLDVLRRGFYDIIDPDSLQHIQSQEVSWCDLQLMVNGIPEVDVEALKASTVYRNGDAKQKKCKWFFEVLEGWQRGEPMCDDPNVRESLDAERHLGFGKQTKLVLKAFEYATGTDRVPAGGYKNLLDKAGNKCPFRIYNLDDEDKKNQMPRGHTCFNQLDLPDYDNRARLAAELHRVISFGMGFGDA